MEIAETETQTRPIARPRTRARIELLGGFRLSISRRPIELKSAKARALLTVLVFAEGGEITRERASSLLWSGSDPERARTSLRQCIRALRVGFEGTGFDGFYADKSLIRLTHDRCDCDIHELERTAQRGLAHKALLGETDVVSAIFDGQDEITGDFDQWIAIEREQLRARLARALERALEEAGDDRNSEDAARALTMISPASEPAVRRLLRAHAASGDYAAAAAAYDRLWTHLAETADDLPSAETQSLFATVRRIAEAGGEAHARTDAQKSAADGPTLLIANPVVAPAVAEPGAHGGGGALGRAFALDLAARLARFDDWRIVMGACDEPPEARLETALLPHRGGWRASSVLFHGQDVIWSIETPLAAAIWDEAIEAGARRLALAVRSRISTRRRLGSAEAPDIALTHVQRRARAAQLAHHLPSGSGARLDELSGESGPASPLARLATPAPPPPLRAREAALARQRALQEEKPLDASRRAALGWRLADTGDWRAALPEFRLAADLSPLSIESAPLAALGLAAGSCGDEAVDALAACGARRGALAALTLFLANQPEQGLLASQDMDATAPTLLLAFRVAALATAPEEQKAADIAALDGRRAELAAAFAGLPVSGEAAAQALARAAKLIGLAPD